MRILLATGAMHPEPGGIPLVDPATGLGAGTVAQALATGWAAARPGDLVTALPVPDGGPGAAQAVPADAVDARSALHARGPLGDVREVDLLRLAAPGVPRPGAAPEGARSWFLDAARLLALPADHAQAAREAAEGTSTGLGEVIAEALGVIDTGDTLVVGLSRSAVHDGGAGALEGLGGAVRARELLDGRDLLLALADDAPLGGMSGAGQALPALTGIAPETAQELDREACARASRALTDLAIPRAGSLPVLGGQPSLAERLSVSSWGTGAAGGSALILRALGAGAFPGARVMAHLLGLDAAVAEADLVVTSSGEVYDVLADCVPAVVGSAASALALPTVLVAGRSVVPRGELAEAGIVSSYALEEMGAGLGSSWDDGGPDAVRQRLTELGGRLARTWSR